MMNTNGWVGDAFGLPTWVYFFAAGIVGLATSVAFVYITQYYTAGSYRPVREIAEAVQTGPATNIITGTAVGFETTLVTAVTIGIALFASYWLGNEAGLVNEADGGNVGGIFGTAVATMGMLMTTAYILAMDTFGPITDNAGGIAEFSRAEASAREITDRLDAVGNTTKALTKGYAIASASLAAFLLFSAYIDKINVIQGRRIEAGVPGAELLESVNLANVNVFIAALIAAMLVYFFSARSPSARSARRPRRSSSRSVASSARCPGSWTTASARTTPASSTSRPRPPSARWSSRVSSRSRRRSSSASCSAPRPSPAC